MEAFGACLFFKCLFHICGQRTQRHEAAKKAARKPPAAIKLSRRQSNVDASARSPRSRSMAATCPEHAKCSGLFCDRSSSYSELLVPRLRWASKSIGNGNTTVDERSPATSCRAAK